MDTHIDGRPTGPTADEIEQRKKLMQAQATRQRRHRANRLDVKLEKELAEGYRRAHMTVEKRAIEDSQPSWGQRRLGPCKAQGCITPIHALRLCMKHYQRHRRALRNRT